MKIEIELETVESLKRQLEYQTKKAIELQSELDKLDEKYLRKQAIQLGEKLFRNYFTAVFEKLGFNQGDPSTDYNTHVDFDYNELNRYLGESSWSSPRLKIEISAHVIEKFKTAFLRIGVIPETETEKVKKLLTEL